MILAASRSLLTRHAVLAAGLLAGSSLVASARAQKPVSPWLTTADGSSQLAPQPSLAWTKAVRGDASVIAIDDQKTYQTIDGFGHALTGGTAQLMMRMSPAARKALLQELFGSGPHDIHTSYLRVSVGASDMNDHVFTYDDLPAGQTDPSLAHFSLAEDEKDVIPILKEILLIQPHIKILASPWTAPAWMKDNGALKAGSLKPEFYDAYARYWVRYLKGMQAHGITIDALTPQNEPENPKNTPSMIMTADQQAEFIGEHLGPALAKAGLKTKIIDFDHNCDHPVYSETVLANAAAAKYTDGSGFHLYLGDISALTAVHDAFPTKNIYFTEQMVVPRRPRRGYGAGTAPGTAPGTGSGIAPGGTPATVPAPPAQALTPASPEAIAQPIASSVARLTIGAPANWSRNVLLWNLAADPQNGPHTSEGGCPVCTGAITLDGDKITRLTAYYVAAHASKFVPPGSVRIGSDAGPDSLPHVAFRTPAGGHVLIVSNPTATERSVVFSFAGKQTQASLAAGAVATYVW